MKWWTRAALLLLVASACDKSPTAPLIPETRQGVAVPEAGPLSTTVPVPGGLSAMSPTAGPMSVESPEALPNGRELSPLLSVSALPGWTPAAQPYQPAEGATANTVNTAMRLLWQNTSTGDRSIWLMNGTTWDGTSFAALPNVPTAWSMAASADFNADGNSDIVWQNTTTGDRSIWFMNNTTWDGSSFVYLPNVNTAWSIAGAGDFNNDGKPDLVWQNTTTGDRSIWFMNGSTWGGSFAALPNVSTQWMIAAIADFNADNKPDLVWQNLITGQRSIWLMNGSTWDGTFALLPIVPTDWRIVGAADFDGDGKPDIVWQNIITGQRSIWIMNGTSWDGTFAILQTVSTAWSIAGTMAPPAASAVARLALTPYPSIVDVGTTLATSVTAYDGSNNPVTTPALTYTSRNSGIATVASNGVITGVAQGQTILVAAMTSTPSIADSVVVAVTAPGGPALYTDISKFGYAVNGNFTVKVFLDMRSSGKTLGSTFVTASWNTSAMTWQGWSASGVSVSPEVNLASTGSGTFTFDMANGTGISGKVELLSFTLKAGSAAGTTGALTLSTSETNAGDLTVMTTQTTGITNPIKLQ